MACRRLNLTDEYEAHISLAEQLTSDHSRMTTYVSIAGEADGDAASEGDGDGGCEHGVVASAANLAKGEDSPQRA